MMIREQKPSAKVFFEQTKERETDVSRTRRKTMMKNQNFFKSFAFDETTYFSPAALVNKSEIVHKMGEQH